MNKVLITLVYVCLIALKFIIKTYKIILFYNIFYTNNIILNKEKFDTF